MPQQKNKNKEKNRQPETNRSIKPKKFAPVQHVHKNLQNSINVQDQVADMFYLMEDHGKNALRQRHLPHWTLYDQTGNVFTN